MVWEQDVSVIVMLTLPVENGEDRCLKYYPEYAVDMVDDDGFIVPLVEKKAHNSSSDRTKVDSRG